MGERRVTRESAGIGATSLCDGKCRANLRDLGENGVYAPYAAEEVQVQGSGVYSPYSAEELLEHSAWNSVDKWSRRRDETDSAVFNKKMRCCYEGWSRVPA